MRESDVNRMIDMAQNSLMKPTMKEIKAQLFYDPETGVFTWLETAQKRWIGKEAGSINLSGYRQISIKDSVYYAHRLAFCYMTGEWPDKQIDHINGNRSDNRWSNLREVPNLVNSQNRKGKGVTAVKAKWKAQITVNYKCKNLGLYATEEEANAIYLEAKNKYHSKAMERNNETDN